MEIQRDFSAYRLAVIQILLLFCMIAIPDLARAAAQKEGIDRGMHQKLVEPSLPEDELRSSERFWEEEDRFILLGDVQAYGLYSNLEGDDLWGGSLYGLIAPAYKIADRSMLIMMYDGQYNRKRELYSDGYGFRERTDFQRHAITPMLRMDFGEGERYSLTPSFNYTATWNKDEGQNDSWDSGLYNYRDVGGGLDFDMREAFGEYGVFRIGAQYYKRRYPNYQNLLAIYDPASVLPSGLEPYKDEKDYHGTIASLGYSWITDAGFSWLTEYNMLYKDFDDKKVVRSNGELSSTEQRDYVHQLDLRFWYFFDDFDGGLNVGLDLQGRIYDSNQNFLYVKGLNSWEVNEDYFDYRAYRISPNITYIFELIPLTTFVSYAYEDLDYTDRWAQNRDRTVLGKGDQWEHIHQVIVGLKYDLSEKMNAIAQWEYLKGRSNNDYEDVYTYAYRVNNIMIGAQYVF